MATGKKTGGRDWKPGQSGNPNGRPKGRSYPLTNVLRKVLQEKYTSKEFGKVEMAEALVRKVVKKAIEEGDATCLKMIWERMEGRPLETHEVMGANAEPIKMIVLKGGNGSGGNGK